jgi:hypothetical protein
VTGIKNAVLLLLLLPPPPPPPPPLLLLKSLYFELQLLRFLSVLTDKNLKDLGRTDVKCISIFFLRMNFPPCFSFGWNSPLKFFQAF